MSSRYPILFVLVSSATPALPNHFSSFVTEHALLHNIIHVTCHTEVTSLLLVGSERHLIVCQSYLSHTKEYTNQTHHFSFISKHLHLTPQRMNYWLKWLTYWQYPSVIFRVAERLAWCWTHSRMMDSCDWHIRYQNSSSYWREARRRNYKKRDRDNSAVTARDRESTGNLQGAPLSRWAEADRWRSEIRNFDSGVEMFAALPPRAVWPSNSSL